MPYPLILGLLSCWLAQGLSASSQNFQIVIERVDPESQSVSYFLEEISGTERRNNALNRSALLSEDQFDYPTPISGCGPTAMLNILIWYEKYGLIPPAQRHSNPKIYKLKLFKEIDQKLTDLAGQRRSDEQGIIGPHAAMVMDQIVKQRSNGKLRIHTELHAPPLKTKVFTDLNSNFRAACLIVIPKSKTSGKLLDAHATTFIRADRSGVITLGTWGELYRGRLKMRGEEQWFIPQNSEHLELKVLFLQAYTPFKPALADAGR